MKYLLFSISLSFMGCNQPEKEVYIIPKNYKGVVVVIFNINDGVPKNYLNECRVYQIPESGVLFTQFSSNTGESGVDDVQFKYVNDKDTLRIKEHIITKDTTSTLPEIFAVKTGVFGDKKYEYISFIVCPYKEWESEYKNFSDVFIDDKHIKAIVDQRLAK